MDIDPIKTESDGSVGRSRPNVVVLCVLAGALLVLIATLAGVGVVIYRDGQPRGADYVENGKAKGSARSQVLAKVVNDWTVTDPKALKKVSPEDALRLNSEVPVSSAANPAAMSMVLPMSNAPNLAAGLECLTTAIYYEAAAEPLDGQRAVAQVILNRVRHPAYPQSICGVVYQGIDKGVSCQFTFACDGALARRPIPALWRRARDVAIAALSGSVYAPVGWSTHYHADYVFPYWAPTLVKADVIGRHIFYRMPGGLGRQGAFRGQYAAVETNGLRHAQEVERVLLSDMSRGLLPELGGGATVSAQARGVLMPSGALANGAADAAAAPAPAVAAPSRYVLGSDGDSLQ
ncbi:MAG: cell wall hydrolase [Sphingobium sp.]